MSDLDTERAATPAGGLCLKDGHVLAPIAGGKGHRRKTVSELTIDELKGLPARDVVTVAAALIGVLHMKEIDLARSQQQHAMAEYNYWGRKLDEAGKALKEAQRVNSEGNT